MDPNWADLAKHVVDYLHPAVVVVGSGIGAGIGKEIVKN